MKYILVAFLFAVAISEGLCKCGENEVYNPCGTACPRTCAQPEFRACNLRCTPGCFCVEGYLYNTKANKCVPKEECHKY